jgi:hypothetical protein
MKSGLLCVRIHHKSVVLLLGLDHSRSHGFDVVLLGRVDFLEGRDLGAKRSLRSFYDFQPFGHLTIL